MPHDPSPELVERVALALYLSSTEEVDSDEAEWIAETDEIRDRFCGHARAALLALRPGDEIGDLVVVPREATEAMLEAAERSWKWRLERKVQGKMPVNPHQAFAAYHRAMIEAAKAKESP